MDEKELPSTVTLLVTTEQAKLLADWNRKANCIWRWSTAAHLRMPMKFIAAQDALIEELYAEPEPRQRKR